jgi:hypothetical protein
MSSCAFFVDLNYHISVEFEKNVKNEKINFKTKNTKTKPTINSAEEPLPDATPHQIETPLSRATKSVTMIIVLRLLAAIAEYIYLAYKTKSWLLVARR